MRGAAILALCCTALAPAWAWGQGQPPTVEGTGQARVVNEDRVAARRRALDEALRQAVERAVDVLLGPEVRATRPNEVRAAAAQARTLVERYRVLAESESGGVYQVQIEATVDAQRLGAALGRGPAPRPAAGPAVSFRLTGPGDAGLYRKALADAGVRLQSPPAARDLSVTRVVVDEGGVRGADVVAARVELTAVLHGQGGADVPLSAGARRFAADAAAARAAAEQAAATDLAQSVARALRPTRTGGVSLRLVGRFGYRHYRAFAQALAAFPQIAAVMPRRFGYHWADLWLQTTLTPPEVGRRIGQLGTPGLSHVVERSDQTEVRVRLEVTDGAAPEGLP